jgi:two-component system, LytTR family, response regulator
MIQCALIEDELASRDILIERLRTFYPELEIKATIREKGEAVKFLTKNRVDLVFMDNHLIGGLGVQVLKEVEMKNMEVIFVTAYTDYALEALNHGATYYLLKPFSDTQFREAVDRALKKISERRRFLMVGTKQDTMIHLNEVNYIESEGVYSVFHMKDGSKVISSKNLGLFESRLSFYNFYRIHHSLIVNVDEIACVEKGVNPMVKLKNGAIKLPISQRKAKAFFETFGF